MLLLGSAVLPALSAWLLVRAAADDAASAIAHGAAHAAAFVAWCREPSPSGRHSEHEASPDDEAGVEPIREASGKLAAPTVRRSKPAEAPARRGILVRRAAVSAAVQRGIRPSAAPVAATSEHPAGLLVNGWGAAGTGLRDGDIIVSLGGGPPSSVDEVIAAVAGAYRRKVYAVSGRIWRAGETIDVSIELPFPEEDASPDAVSSGSHQRTPRSTGAP